MIVVWLFLLAVACLVAVLVIPSRVRPRILYRFTSISLVIRSIRPLALGVAVRFLVFLEIPSYVV